jgi:hypothetical protein
MNENASPQIPEPIIFLTAFPERGIRRSLSQYLMFNLNCLLMAQLSPVFT